MEEPRHGGHGATRGSSGRASEARAGRQSQLQSRSRSRATILAALAATALSCGEATSETADAEARRGAIADGASREADNGSRLERLWRTADDATSAAAEAAGTARERIEALYREARAAGESVPSDVWDWTAEDIARIGDFEYRVERLAGDRMDVQEALNALGADRWEAYWQERDDTGLTVYLKRRARSYLQRIRIGDLIRMLPDGSASP